MITQQPGAPERARVIGSLTGEALQVLLDAVDSGVTVFDLSEVDQVDDSAVHLLAKLQAERCTFVACSRWLELWLASVRGTPEASPVDGFLDVFVMGATSKGALLAKLLRRHLRLPAADPEGLLCRGRRVSVTASPTLRAEMGLLPGRLPVLVSVETARRLHRDGRHLDALAGRAGPRAA
jgi:hypothetical protein